jgi:hypothetical protein
MLKAGNGLRSNLLQAMVQSKLGGQGGKFPQLGGGVSQQQKLQALLQRLGGGGMGRSGGPRDFGHMGGPTGIDLQPGQRRVDPPGHMGGDPISNAVGQARDEQQQQIGQLGGNDPSIANALRNQFRPADILHGNGQDQQAAQVWEQNHPGAAGSGNGHIPNWVLEGLTNAVSTGGLHPTHMQMILEHLSNALGQGQGGPIGQAGAQSGPPVATRQPQLQ